MKQCNDNIDQQYTELCSQLDVNHKYSQQRMIDEYSHDTEVIDGLSISHWFEKHSSKILQTYEYCVQILQQINDMTIKCKNNINIKTNFLLKKIRKQNINEYILYAPVRQLQIYKLLIECIIKIHQPCLTITNKSFVKFCVCCNRQYYLEMLLCSKYCHQIDWFCMSQCVTNHNICCCFCVPETLSQDSSLENCKMLLKHRNVTTDKTFICWWDFSEYLWRYGLILKVIDKSIMNIKILIVDTDSVNPRSCMYLTLQYMTNKTFFIFWNSNDIYGSIDEDQFVIDEHNAHIIGWQTFKNAFKNTWQIPIKTQQGICKPVYFCQINHSVQLYNTLCTNQIL